MKFHRICYHSYTYVEILLKKKKTKSNLKLNKKIRKSLKFTEREPRVEKVFSFSLITNIYYLECLLAANNNSAVAKIFHLELRQCINNAAFIVQDDLECACLCVRT